MEKGWVKIYESSDTMAVEMLRQRLEESEIYSVVLNKRDSSYMAFGNAELYVHESNKEAAQKLIAE